MMSLVWTNFVVWTRSEFTCKLEYCASNEITFKYDSKKNNVLNAIFNITGQRWVGTFHSSVIGWGLSPDSNSLDRDRYIYMTFIVPECEKGVFCVTVALCDIIFVFDEKQPCGYCVSQHIDTGWRYGWDTHPVCMPQKAQESPFPADIQPDSHSEGHRTL